ncbi:hypothetical protein LAZ67_18002232 [Cordylochernes scorpioides]|uniref:Uncharacterized protein n=1 Tax=Cordylochernes scorpioides TaxID=51811 RepID=A0ABY6LGG7_9ARAC|nr:hypothetical protein LAZ67_18002232 [Cordylochernes scorpioides]
MNVSLSHTAERWRGNPGWEGHGFGLFPAGGRSGDKHTHWYHNIYLWLSSKRTHRLWPSEVETDMAGVRSDTMEGVELPLSRDPDDPAGNPMRNVSILGKINSGRSLESRIGKQRLTYFKHIMRENG